MRWKTLWEGRWIFAALAALLLLCLLLFDPFWALIPLALLLYTLWFFRDPIRRGPDDPHAVLAAADGLVMDIEETEEPEVLKTRTLRIGIFLSIFDVHVNRAPVGGEIIYVKEHPGAYLDARHRDSGTRNAARTWAIRNGETTVVVRQVVGLIARRIVGWAKEGDVLRRGERFGMIRFGSRTEIYLPLDSTVTVEIGARVKCGETVVARLPSP